MGRVSRIGPLFAWMVCFSVVTVPVASGQGILSAWNGGAAGEALGASASEVGDWNGDGFSDVVLGAPGGGYVLVVSGRNGSILLNATGGASFGAAVDAAGDVDADGVPDVIVGAPLAGRAEILSGATGAVLLGLDASAATEFGRAVGGAGDVDGDGFDDVIVGAPSDPRGGLVAGSATVFSGASGAALYTFVGTQLFGRLGGAAAAAGDFDQDGFADVIVGAPGQADVAPVSSAAVYSGATGATLFAKNWVLGPLVGRDVGAAGDANGDGAADVFIARAPGPVTVTVYSGSTGAPIRSLAASLDARVAAAGDVDADGLDDLVLGDPGTGSASVWSVATDAFVYQVFAEPPSIGFGAAVSGVGDANGDGFDDIVVGDSTANELGPESGTVRLYSSTCGTIASYGAGCAGAGGFAPTLTLAGCSTRGASLALEIHGGPGGAAFLIAGGAQRSSIPIGLECILLVGQPFTPIFSSLLDDPGQGPGTGDFEVTAKLPVLLMGTVTVQTFVQDEGTAVGITVTNGVELFVP